MFYLHAICREFQFVTIVNHWSPKLEKTIEKPLLPMVDPARNHRWWWWEFSKTIAIPSLEKNNHRHSIALKNWTSLRSCADYWGVGGGLQEISKYFYDFDNTSKYFNDFDNTSKYFCFKIPTFFFWLEALIPCLPHSLASICALKKTQSQHRVASNFQPGELNSENTCDETGTGWWGFCEPCWWSRQLQVLRWHRPQGLGFLPQDCELLRSETAAASHSPLRPIIQIIIQIVHELYPQLLF